MRENTKICVLTFHSFSIDYKCILILDGLVILVTFTNIFKKNSKDS